MRTRFDQFAKQMTQAAFVDRGTVQTDEEVSPEVGRIDVWYTPSDPAAPQGLRELGMLGRIGEGPFTMEAFHKPPDPGEVMDVVCKHRAFRMLRDKRAPDNPLPFQWIVSAGKPARAMEGLRCEPCEDWGKGVYDLPPLHFARLVVVAELPRTRDTLLLRLMGAGKTLRDAVADLHALEDNAPERRLSLPLLRDLRIDFEKDAKKDKEEEEFLMRNGAEIVKEYWAEMDRHKKEALDQGLAEGQAKGQAQGMAQSILKVYTRRFGAPPPEVTERLTHMLDPDTLDAWLDLAVTGTAEDLPRAIRNLPTS